MNKEYVVLCRTPGCPWHGIAINWATISEENAEALERDFRRAGEARWTRSTGRRTDNLMREDFCPECRIIGRIVTMDNFMEDHGRAVRDRIMRYQQNGGVQELRIGRPYNNVGQAVIREVVVG